MKADTLPQERCMNFWKCLHKILQDGRKQILKIMNFTRKMRIGGGSPLWRTVINARITGLQRTLQTAYAILESQAKLELEQKKQSKRIEKVETTIGNMKNILIEPIGDWQNDINTRVREVSYKSGIEFQALYGQLYDELEKVAHCNLKQLQHNRKNRLEKAGNTKAEIIARSAKIAIIHDKPQLKAIFENIVRKYAMIYCS